MKVLVIILGSMVALVALLLMMALILKTDYTITREIVINRPSPEVYEYTRLLKNQDAYSKWVMQDPKMKKEYRGDDGNVGFVYAWDSENKNVGKGEQEIVKLVNGTRVDAEVRFVKPFQSVATTSMITEPVSENQTKVSWTMKGVNTFPVNLMNPFMDNLLGKDLQISLINLKQILEK